MATSTAPPTSSLEEKIDALSGQVALLTEEARVQRMRREAITELQADLAPIATRAVERMTSELDGMEWNPDDAVRLARRLAENTATLEKALAQMESLVELYAEAKPIIDRVVAVGIERLGELDERGYFEFMNAGFGVLDRVVVGFSQEEVEQLGDNVVLILQTIKEMTQPEIMAVIYRMIEAIHRQQATLEAEPDEAPGFWSLFQTLRQPEVRRGLGRALNTLQAVSDVDSGPPRMYVRSTSADLAADRIDDQEQTTETKTSEGGN